MNFGEMVAQIADDLIDERLTNIQIQNAVNQAMRFYSRRTFYFNQVKVVVNVVSGQEYYPVTNTSIFVADLYTIQIVKFRPTGDLNGWSLDPVRDASIEDAQLNTGRAPAKYAYAQMQLRLYPKPTVAGTCTIIATYMYPKFVADTDSNVFLERADELIRQAAKRYIANNVLHDQALADRVGAMEAEEYASLLAEGRNREPLEPLQSPIDLVAMTYITTMATYDVRNDK